MIKTKLGLTDDNTIPWNPANWEGLSDDVRENTFTCWDGVMEVLTQGRCQEYDG